MQCLPRYQTAVLTCQEDEAGSNFRGLTRSAHGSPAELIHGILLHCRGDQWGPYGAGSDGVDADTESNLLVGQATGEGDDGTFGGGVVQKIGATDVGVDGGVVDDGVTRFHVLKSVLGDVEIRVDIGVEGLEPLISRDGWVQLSVQKKDI